MFEPLCRLLFLHSPAFTLLVNGNKIPGSQKYHWQDDTAMGFLRTSGPAIASLGMALQQCRKGTIPCCSCAPVLLQGTVRSCKTVKSSSVSNFSEESLIIMRICKVLLRAFNFRQCRGVASSTPAGWVGQEADVRAGILAPWGC